MALRVSLNALTGNFYLCTVGGKSEKSGNEKNLVLENQSQPELPKSEHDRVMPKEDISISSNEVSF